MSKCPYSGNEYSRIEDNGMFCTKKGKCGCEKEVEQQAVEDDEFESQVEIMRKKFKNRGFNHD